MVTTATAQEEVFFMIQKD